MALYPAVGFDQSGSSHWIVKEGERPEVAQWFCGEWFRGEWLLCGVSDQIFANDEEDTRGWSYLGPVLPIAYSAPDA